MPQLTPGDVHVDQMINNADETPTADATTDNAATTEANTDTPQRGPSMIYMRKLVSLLADAVGTSVFKTAQASARGHAGGKTSPKPKAANDRTIDDVLAMRFYGDYDEMCDMPMSPEVNVVKLEKADPRVNYRDATDIGSTCGDCAFFQFGACRVVEGMISARSTCDLLLPSMNASETINIADLCAIETLRFTDDVGNETANVRANVEGYRLFNEVTVGNGVFPDRLPIMPKPGVYHHRQYGKVIITRERNQRFAENFNRAIYQDRVGVNCEHMPVVSGAVGWIVNMTFNDRDGTVDGTVEWSARGKLLMENKAFVFGSPEWLDQWTDPATLETFSDVITGYGLTTKPFYKPKYLRALVASENGDLRVAQTDPKTGKVQFSVAQYEGNNIMGETNNITMPAAATTTVARPAVATSGTPTRQFSDVPADIARQFSEMVAENTRLQEQVRIASERAEAANVAVAAMETAARIERYRQLAMGNGDPNARWFGEIDGDAGHVSRLMVFSTLDGGEESPAFVGYVEQQRAIAAQLNTTQLFSERGSSMTVHNGDVASRVMAMAQQRATERGIKSDDAMLQVFSENPELYRQYIAQTTIKV